MFKVYSCENIHSHCLRIFTCQCLKFNVLLSIESNISQENLTLNEAIWGSHFTLKNIS